MKIWILGAEGLLGTYLCQVCLEKNIPYIGSSKQEANILDVDSLKSSLDRVQPTCIINCAAYTNVDRAEQDKEAAFLLNAQGAENVGILAQKNGIKILHLSTDYVFDGKKEQPYEENDPCCPLNTYGASKWEGEKRLLEQCPTACVVRTSWLFGRGGRNFFSVLLKNFKEKEHIAAVHDQVARMTFCQDLAHCLLTLQDESGIFHFANQGALSRFEAVAAIYALQKKSGQKMTCTSFSPLLYRDLGCLTARPSYSVLSTKKVERILDKPIRRWEDAFQEFGHAAE